VAGYIVSSASGTITVNGASVTETTTFTATFLGLPATEGYVVLGGVLVAIAAVAAVAVLLSRRRKAPPAPVETPAPPPATP
jgi:hypothetical protein